MLIKYFKCSSCKKDNCMLYPEQETSITENGKCNITCLNCNTINVVDVPIITQKNIADAVVDNALHEGETMVIA